jgi:5-methylcytosine-specific restriction endonuclease McrBC GTP-binding regulatory subunit McrB
MNNNLIKISNELLDELLEFKSKNPDFTFSLRQRDSVQSDEKRLENGQWFQGSSYIYVPLFQKGDSARKIKTIGFVINFNPKQQIDSNHIEISFKDGVKKPNEIKFHEELAQEIGIHLDKYNNGKKLYPDPNAYIQNIKHYITQFRKLALEALKRNKIETGYIISEGNFQKRLQKINKIKLKLKQSNPNTSSDILLNSNKIITQPLNQILFGPPGTGKTYNTINKALEIMDEAEEKQLDWKDRSAVKAQFDKRVSEGRIVFTTFHQSMSYEDFIEGIKPLKPMTDDKFVRYDIEPGIFYSICETAKSNFQNSKSENKRKLNFEEAFDKFKEEWEKYPEMKFPLKTEGYDFTIIGFTNYSIQFKKASGGTSHTLSIGTLKELYYGREFDFKQGVGIYYPAVLKKVQSFQSDVTEEIILKKYVLIIDEINRGNVSQIFGELITLIEEDKRLGETEALEALLPYSKEKFGVPPNLYIIGTMNTADKSVEAIDAALRRRFSFEEMMPRPELLTPLETLRRFWDKHTNKYGGSIDSYNSYEIGIRNLLGMSFKDEKAYFNYGENVKNQFTKEEFEENLKDNVAFNGINLEQLLLLINKRIEKLLDKDHQIGHSYFMDISSIEELKVAFKNKIIPLLQEYFFGDYGKIGLVLGKGFIKKKEWNNTNDSFADFDTESASDFDEREVYEIIDYTKPNTKYSIKIEDGVAIEMDFEKAMHLLMNKKIG